MGRPKKQPADRRTLTVSCRITDAERLRIEAAAARAGLSTSEYVRKQTLAGKVVVQENRQLGHAAFDQLRRIGVNLNQLTRIAHKSGRISPEIVQAAATIELIVLREIDRGAARLPAGENPRVREPESGGS